RAIQDHLVQRLFRDRLPYSPYYRALLAKERIATDRVRGVDDLRRLPFTTKRDLLPTAEEPERYRSFILQPDETLLRAHLPLRDKLRLLEERILHGADAARRSILREYYPVFLTFTTGRSAAPVPFVYTQHDLDMLQVSGLRMIDVMGLPQQTRTVNLFPYAPHLAFWQVTMAGFAAGQLILGTGGGKVLGTAGNVNAILRMKANALIGVPGFVYHVLRHGLACGARMPELRSIVLGAEKISREFKEKTVALAAELGASNVSVFGTYGSTELRMAFAECPTAPEHSSGYHSSPDLVLLECVDPTTGEPSKPGEDGELVITPLQGTGSVVVRYRTGDLLRGGLHLEPCPHCRRTVPRIPSRIDRISELAELRATKVKGTLVNLADFAQALSGMREVDEWQVEIRKRGDDPFEVDELALYVAPHDGVDRDILSDRIRGKLLAATEISPNEIVFLTLEQLLSRLGMETEMKERRFVDRRPKA
ncbi:MAG TPA: AMP-binding protein, partial [Planctomycetota bacterium]|nr:AMP-binding protein [Planctomycetota bacterium]